jgi:hypothetical protein
MDGREHPVPIPSRAREALARCAGALRARFGPRLLAVWRETDLVGSPVVMPREQYKRWRQQERPLVMDVERDGISA